MRIEIDLTFNRKYFEAIYFKNFQGDYFRSETIKAPFRNLLLGAITLLVFYFYGDYKDDYTLFIIWVFVFCAILWGYISALNTIIKWKKKCC